MVVYDEDFDYDEASRTAVASNKQVMVIDRVLQSSAQMDAAKLLNLNGQYMAALPFDAFLEGVRAAISRLPWAATADAATPGSSKAEAGRGVVVLLRDWRTDGLSDQIRRGRGRDIPFAAVPAARGKADRWLSNSAETPPFSSSASVASAPPVRVSSTGSNAKCSTCGTSMPRWA